MVKVTRLFVLAATFLVAIMLSLASSQPAAAEGSAERSARIVALDSVSINSVSLTPSSAIEVRITSQPTRPSDSALFDAMQTDLKSLAWRQSDGRYRATSHTGTAGPWEVSVRDAVWRALFATTQ